MSGENKKEEKVYCRRCGREINKYAYLKVVFEINVMVEETPYKIGVEDRNFCLHCFLTYKGNISELFGGDC
jgi:hypothetical protein